MEVWWERWARSVAYDFGTRVQLVQAAGIEPLLPANLNPMMAHDFGFFGMKTIELPRRFLSPRVPSSPLESSPVLEILETAGDLCVADQLIRQEMIAANGSAHSFCPNETASVPL